MPNLIIQIDSTVANDDFNWLGNALVSQLREFNLDPLYLTPIVHIEPPLPAPPPNYSWTTPDLYNRMMPIIQNSQNKINADSNGDWFVDLFITTHHINRYLGLMYDIGVGNQSRQGCAVFWQEVNLHTSNNLARYRDVLCRTALHEIGHCLNLTHVLDGSLMTQTQDLQNMFGGGWINNINFNYDQGEINWVINNSASSMPGGPGTNFGIEEDVALFSRKLSVKIKHFNDEPKPKIISGQTVALLVEIINNGDAPVTLQGPFSMESGRVKVWLTAPGEPKRLLKSPVCGCDPLLNDVEITRGTKYFPLYLFSGNRNYLFDQPGNYKIRVAVKGKGKSWYRSNKINVKILPAEGKELTLKSLITHPDVVGFLMLGGTYPKAALSIKKVLRTAPESEASKSIYWTTIHMIKEKLQARGSKKKPKYAIRRLFDIYDQLLQAETVTVRKGKILKEIALLKQATGEPVLQSNNEKELLQAYEQFEEGLLRNDIKTFPYEI
jgi:hypothetical protein